MDNLTAGEISTCMPGNLRTRYPSKKMQRAKTISTISSSGSPEAWRVLLESSSKPLVIKGQLASWLGARSWKATAVCEDLSSTPPTSFKLCPRRDSPLHKFLTGVQNRALFETDCTYVEATFSDFQEWIERNYPATADTVETDTKRDKETDKLDSKREKERLSYQSEDCEVPELKKRKTDQSLSSSPDPSDKKGENSSNPLLTYPGSQYWVYADYKYMCNLCPNVTQSLRDPVDWGMFGFKSRGWRDSVLWIGSVGACTPCHYDSYGCNLVAQLSGRKSWTMFAPCDSASMYGTRVPYEETSVFSEVDMAEPDYGKHPRFREATPYQVVLEEGDVLLVPKHWWHYVECVGQEPSVSINTWIQQSSDSYDKIREVLVRTLVSAFASDGTDSGTDHGLLNPNEEVSLCNAFNISCLSQAIREHRQSRRSHDQQTPPTHDHTAPPLNTTPSTSAGDDAVRSHDQQAPPSPQRASVDSETYRGFVKALTSERVLDTLMDVMLEQTD